VPPYPTDQPLDPTSGLNNAEHAPRNDDQPLFAISGLVTDFVTQAGTIRAVDHVSYELYAGEVLGIVGESGSGKSATVLSALRLVSEPPARIVAGEVWFQGRNLLDLSPEKLRTVRGGEIGMVFQDPMTSLNPVLTIGRQIQETIAAHRPGMSSKEIRNRAIELLAVVGIPDPDRRVRQYPHEFSGGMRQRAMVAIAIANDPAVLIADEPTTALDVTIQAQLVDLLEVSIRDVGAAAIWITHDLGLIAEIADRVVVMYAGRLVETGSVDDVFNNPQHPYTVGLLKSLPTLDVDVDRLIPIVGHPPNLLSRPGGCAFRPRCSLSQGRQACVDQVPSLLSVRDGHSSACHFADEVGRHVSDIGRSD